MKKSNQEETRQHNRRLVLNTIYQSKEISRVEIARRTQLTRTTVSEIVAEFIDMGLVIEIGLAPSSGGKPATLLRVDEYSRLILGIDLAEQEFCGALVNLRGNIIQRLCLPLEVSNGENAYILVTTLIEQLLQYAEQPILGIGIGVPGLMDPGTGSVHQAVNLDWNNLPLGKLLHKQFELPVYLANDCQVAALGEFTFGGNQRKRNLIVIKAGRGIGAGIVLDGALFYGDNAGAGEIGHIRVVDHGEICPCGNRGCLETVVSKRALIDSGRQINPDQIKDFDTLVNVYQAGNPQVVALIENAGKILGNVTAHLVSLLNINRVLLSGSLTIFANGLIPPIRQRVELGVLPSLGNKTDIGLATLGNDIVILGGASLILKNVLGLL